MYTFEKGGWGTEAESLKRYSASQCSGSNSQSWWFFFFEGEKGEKSETGCLQRHLPSSPASAVCADPLPRMVGAEQWSCSQGKNNTGYIFRCLGDARPHTVTSRSPPGPQTCCKLAQTLMFFGHALTWGLHSQGIMVAKNSSGHKPVHSSKDWSSSVAESGSWEFHKEGQLAMATNEQIPTALSHRQSRASCCEVLPCCKTVQETRLPPFMLPPHPTKYIYICTHTPCFFHPSL